MAYDEGVVDAKRDLISALYLQSFALLGCLGSQLPRVNSGRAVATGRPLIGSSVQGTSMPRDSGLIGAENWGWLVESLVKLFDHL